MLYTVIFYFSDCPIVRVSLKNEVLHKLGFLQGDYQISTRVNGKPSWTKSTYVIYYRKGYWAIGPMESIGGEFAWIYASNDFSGLTDSDNVWKFLTFRFSIGSHFEYPSNPTDIQIAYIHER